MYLVRDCYGTRQRCWSMREAMDWLGYCSPRAWIESGITGRVLRVRIINKLGEAPCMQPVKTG